MSLGMDDSTLLSNRNHIHLLLEENDYQTLFLIREQCNHCASLFAFRNETEEWSQPIVSNTILSMRNNSNTDTAHNQ